jgi:tRNA(Ile)-lysidine synthase
MNLLKQFQEHYKQNLSTLFPANNKFILAVSGGVDSVVLVDFFAKSNLNFVIAHCNFKLRGEESERDEQFVKALAVKHSKEIFVKHFDTKRYADENKVSIQVAARDLRYNWFKELQSTVNSQRSTAIVTAHHQNDNIETVLINFFRGTGIQGLTGISEFDKERKILRPLLPFKKEELLQYATDNSLTFVEDSSNAINKYTRNNFRNQIIPLVKQHFPSAEENLLSNIHRLNEVELLYNETIEKYKKSLIVLKGEELHIPILKLKKVKALHTIIWELIKDFNFNAAQVNEVVKLLDSNNGSYIQSATHRIINNRNWIIITPLKEDESQTFIIEKEDKKIEFGNSKIVIEQLQTLNFKPQISNEVATLDFDTVEFPLVLRKWKQGDYFYPLGMTKKQKLSKFFINQKLSLTQKENVWVVESNKRIVWVIGYRIDNRFKITERTKEIIKMSYLM